MPSCSKPCPEPPKATTLSALKDIGFTDPGAVIATVQSWQHPKSGGLRAREARERVDADLVLAPDRR